ncbi:MAG: sporulation membrane protein YtaF [Bacilli bacterium]
MHFITICLIAIALSIDSASVGVTYGLRGLRVDVRTVLIISFCTAAVLWVAMSVGSLLAHIFHPDVATKLGGVILILLGAYVLYSFFFPKESKPITMEPSIVNFEIAMLGIVIQILRHPTEADVDRSGTISPIEAFLLGLALSLDSFGAGLAAAMMGIEPFLLALSVGVMSFIFLSFGLLIGRWGQGHSWMERLMFLPGVLLILMGVLRL